MAELCLSVSPSVIVWANAGTASNASAALGLPRRRASAVGAGMPVLIPAGPIVVVLGTVRIGRLVRLMVTFFAFLHALPSALGH